MTDGSEDAVPQDEPDWRTPAALIDTLERKLWALFDDIRETPDGYPFVVADAGHVDVLGTIIVRQIRQVLKEAGLDVPLSGDWERLAAEERASREATASSAVEVAMPDPPVAASQTIDRGDTDGPPYWWQTPAHLLDCVELDLRRIRDGEDGEHVDPVGYTDGMLVILMPELRGVLRAAGLDIPAMGPHSARGVPDDIEPPQAPPAVQTPLYRWFDADQVLIYVGITDNLGNRTKSHAKGSTWMEFAVSSTVERHPSRPAALRAERDAIKTERPVFNSQHNDPKEAGRRIVDYLIAHDRLDLLAPAITRG